MSISTVDKCVLTYGRVMSTSMILDAEIFLRMHQHRTALYEQLQSQVGFKSPQIQFSAQVTLVDLFFLLSWGIYGLSGAVGVYVYKLKNKMTNSVPDPYKLTYNFSINVGISILRWVMFWLADELDCVTSEMYAWLSLFDNDYKDYKLLLFNVTIFNSRKG